MVSARIHTSVRMLRYNPYSGRATASQWLTIPSTRIKRGAAAPPQGVGKQQIEVFTFALRAFAGPTTVKADWGTNFPYLHVQAAARIAASGRPKWASAIAIADMHDQGHTTALGTYQGEPAATAILQFLFTSSRFGAHQAGLQGALHTRTHPLLV